MNYADFKAHLLVFLWKQNDLDLIGSLDNLITMANSELNVSLRISDTEVSTLLYADTDTVQLPLDYKSFRLVMSPQLGELTYVTPSDLFTKRVNYAGQTLPFFSLQSGQMLLCFFPDPTAADPRLPLIVTYDTAIPDFRLSGTSWFADKFLSLYTYAVLMQTAPFLREDERFALWEQRYNTLLGTLNEEDAFFRNRGVAASALTQSVSSVTRRKRR